MPYNETKGQRQTTVAERRPPKLDFSPGDPFPATAISLIQTLTDKGSALASAVLTAADRAGFPEGVFVAGEYSPTADVLIAGAQDDQVKTVLVAGLTQTTENPPKSKARSSAPSRQSRDIGIGFSLPTINLDPLGQSHTGNFGFCLPEVNAPVVGQKAMGRLRMYELPKVSIAQQIGPMLPSGAFKIGRCVEVADSQTDFFTAGEVLLPDTINSAVLPKPVRQHLRDLGPQIRTRAGVTTFSLPEAITKQQYNDARKAAGAGPDLSWPAMIGLGAAGVLALPLILGALPFLAVGAVAVDPVLVQIRDERILAMFPDANNQFRAIAATAQVAHILGHVAGCFDRKFESVRALRGTALLLEHVALQTQRALAALILPAVMSVSPSGVTVALARLIDRFNRGIDHKVEDAILGRIPPDARSSLMMQALKWGQLDQDIRKTQS